MPGSGGQVDGDAGDAAVVEVQEIGRRGEGAGVGDGLDDAGPDELSEPPVDRILRQVLEAVGDLTRTRPGNERSVAIFGSNDQFVEDDERVGPCWRTNLSASG